MMFHDYMTMADPFHPSVFNCGTVQSARIFAKVLREQLSGAYDVQVQFFGYGLDAKDGECVFAGDGIVVDLRRTRKDRMAWTPLHGTASYLDSKGKAIIVIPNTEAYKMTVTVFHRLDRGA